MDIHAIVGNARLYMRSEAMIAEIRLGTFMQKFALMCFAIFVVLIGVVFLNVAAFAYLQSMWGPIWTPLAVGLGNFGLAILAALIAASIHPGPELAMAKELRKLSAGALEAELHASQSASGMLGALSAGRDMNVARLLVPAVISIVSAMARRKTTPKK